MGATTETIKLRSKDDTRKGINSAKRNLSGLQKMAKNASGAVAGIATATGVAALTNLTKKTLDAADAVEKLSRRSKSSVQFISEMRFSLSQNDVTVNEFNRSLVKINKSTQDAADGLQAPTKAFDKLGINVEKFQRLNTDQKFIALSEAISKIEDPAKRTQIAMDIMGRSGTQLLTVMENGAQGIAEYRDQAVKMGLSLSQEQAQGAAAANDAIDKLTKSISGAFTQSILEGTDEIITMADWLTGVLPQAVSGITNAFGLMADGIGFVFEIGKRWVDFMTVNLPTVGAGVDFVVNGFIFLGKVFTDTELIAIALVEGVLVGLEQIKSFAAKTAAAFKLAFVAAFDVILETYATLIDKIGEGADLIGADDLAASVRGFGDDIRGVLTPLEDYDRKIAEIDQATKKAIQGVRAITGDMADQAIAAKNTSKSLLDADKSTRSFDMATIAAGESSEDLKKRLKDQSEATKQLRKEQERLAKATGTDLLRSQKELNRVLDEADLYQKNYNKALVQAAQVLTSRGLVAGTKEYSKALEDLGFKTDKLAEDSKNALPTIEKLWENTVGSVQSNLQGFFRKGLDGFDNWYDSILDSLKDFLAAFLAQWAASGILGLINGDGFSGFSIDNAFGTGAQGSGLQGIFGSKTTQQAAGRVFGQEAGQNFNAALNGAGGALSIYGGVNQIDQGLEQGGTSGALSVASGLASLYTGTQKVISAYQALTGATQAASAATQAGTIITNASAAAVQSSAAAAQAAATANTTAANVITNASAAAVEAQAAGTAATSGSAAAALGATAAWIGVGLVADQALNDGRVTKGFLKEFDIRKESLSDLKEGNFSDFFKKQFTAPLASLKETFGGRSFEQIIAEDYLPDLLGQNISGEAIGLNGGIGFNGGNTAIFGATNGIVGSGLTSQLLNDGGENGNGGFFNGAQRNLEEFQKILEANGIEAKIAQGTLRALSRDGSKTTEDIINLWSEYAAGITEAVKFTDVYATAVSNNLIRSDNLFFENFALGFGQNAFEARDALLQIDTAFDALVAGGAEKTQALTQAFSEFYGLAAEDTATFFDQAGIRIEDMATQFEQASGESLEALLDFNADGITTLETLVNGSVQAADSVQNAMTDAALMAGESFNFMQGDISQALSKVTENVTAANEQMVLDFDQTRNRVQGSWDGLSLGNLRPLVVPTISVPQQVSPGSEDPFLGSFNTGGRFIVPGQGNSDRPFRINLTPGEEVTVKPKSDNDVNVARNSVPEDDLREVVHQLADTVLLLTQSMKREKAKKNAA